jgi:hypothetical protein
MSHKPEDKDKPHDLREGLAGRVVPGGLAPLAEVHEPHQPHIVTPAVEEHVEGQTTHE